MNRSTNHPPLVFDLAGDIRTPRWWRAIAMMFGGLVAIAWLAATVIPAPGSSAPSPAPPAAEGKIRGVVTPSGENDGTRRPVATLAAQVAGTALVDDAARITGATAQAAAQKAAPARLHHRQLSLRRGERLIDLLKRAGLDRRTAYRWATALVRVIDARRLRAGQRFDLAFSPAVGEADGKGARMLRRLSFKPEIDRRIAVTAPPAGAPLSVAVREVPIARLWGYAQGRITESLYVDARRQGVPATVLVRLMRVLGFVVDFEREIWPGDRFEILYARPIADDDGRTGEGEPIHVALTLRGRRIAFTRFVDRRSGRVDFFDENGHSVRRTLMKTPLDGARLTSRFGRRRHPILGYVRAHRGLDFGAPRGTPVYAAGDGTVERASRFGSYGNYVRIRHGSGYETAYAHLSRFARGIRKGVRVRQGRTIGYVGASGRATGPHLHYEVLVNGRQVDPLRLKLPSGRRLAGEALARFRKWSSEVEAMRSELAHTRAVLIAARTRDAENTTTALAEAPATSSEADRTMGTDR